MQLQEKHADYQNRPLPPPPTEAFQQSESDGRERALVKQTLNNKLSVNRASDYSPQRNQQRMSPTLVRKHEFMENLNTKLSHYGTLGGNVSPKQIRKAANTAVVSLPPHGRNSVVSPNTAGSEMTLKVRNWLSSRSMSDPHVRHESLLEQIRRGTKLRKSVPLKDNSAPRLY